MIIWILEYRENMIAAADFSSVVYGIYSTKQKAIDKALLDGCEDESWYCLYSEEVDVELSTSPLTFIDRKGNVGKKQPCYPPYLIKTSGGEDRADGD